LGSLNLKSTHRIDHRLFDFNPFEKNVFSKRSRKTTSCFIVSTGCFTISVLEIGLTLVDFAVKLIQPVVSIKQLIVF